MSATVPRSPLAAPLRGVRGVPVIGLGVQGDPERGIEDQIKPRRLLQHRPEVDLGRLHRGDSSLAPR